MSPLKAALKELEASIKEARADQRRLSIAQLEVWDIQHYGGGQEWTVEIDGGDIIGKGKTIREALDAAIASPRNRIGKDCPSQQ